MQKSPIVYIIGAGPGDPDLLTRKAYQILTEMVDVVVYDRLVPDEILAIIPKEIEKIYAGKSCKTHHMTQDEIHIELLRQVRSGKQVARLKGGDPFIFGRGGEEVLFLAEHDVTFEIIPGISAATGISAALGVPLTHRGTATSVQFITGHQQNGEKTSHNWNSLSDPQTTLVVYMGLTNLGTITGELMAHGRSPDTPAIVVQDGTTPMERVCVGTLQNIAGKVRSQDITAPAITLIGDVVRVAQLLGTVNMH